MNEQGKEVKTAKPADQAIAKTNGSKPAGEIA
jgi:hypothetical protein